MIRTVLVLGAGSAGLMAALSLKRHLPELKIQVLRDPGIPVIGVGESTTPNVPSFLFGHLRLDPRRFYEVANPTWKLGIHFLWGPRPCFEYSFLKQMDAQWADLPQPHGYYCWDDFAYADLTSALMAHGKAFPRDANGGPDIQYDHGYHLYNPDYVRSLEIYGKEWGIEYVDGTVDRAERGPEGIAALRLKDGRRMAADLFVDASGFGSQLLGKALDEPFISYGSSLYCDRAVVGSWERTTEPILPYTTAETMEAGWCWQIEHEKQINRGYVFCSGALSDDAARDEFLRKNPKARTWNHVVKFKSGRYRRGWVDNVVAVGNSGGFVEPLEATAIMLVCAECQTLTAVLRNARCELLPTMRDLYNDFFTSSWDEIRNFLSIHYRFNTRINNAFWRDCCATVDVSPVQRLLDFYRENGPTGLCRYVLGHRGQEFGIHSAFGVEGYLVILMGNKVPYTNIYQPTAEEWSRWKAHRDQLAAHVRNALTVEESLQYVRHPAWRWMAA